MQDSYNMMAPWDFPSHQRAPRQGPVLRKVLSMLVRKGMTWCSLYTTRFQLAGAKETTSVHPACSPATAHDCPWMCTWTCTWMCTWTCTWTSSIVPHLISCSSNSDSLFNSHLQASFLPPAWKSPWPLVDRLPRACPSIHHLHFGPLAQASL